MKSFSLLHQGYLGHLQASHTVVRTASEMAEMSSLSTGGVEAFLILQLFIFLLV